VRSAEVIRVVSGGIPALVASVVLGGIPVLVVASVVLAVAFMVLVADIASPTALARRGKVTVEGSSGAALENCLCGTSSQCTAKFAVVAPRFEVAMVPKSK